MGTIHTSQPVKAAKLTGSVVVGFETAARLGVPVGTRIDLGTLATWHRNPIIRFWRNLRVRTNSWLSE